MLLSPPIALAVEHISEAVRFADLRATILDHLSTATPAAVEGTLTSLLTEGFSVTELATGVASAGAVDGVVGTPCSHVRQLWQLDRSLAGKADRRDWP